MPLAKFDDFLKSLHDEIVRLEFAHYDYQGKVGCSEIWPADLVSIPVCMPIAILFSTNFLVCPSACITVKSDGMAVNSTF